MSFVLKFKVIKTKLSFDYQLVGVSVGTVDFAQIQALASSLHLSADYLYAGNVIGEMGLLTDSVRNASVSCETTCQVQNFQIQHLIIDEFVIINLDYLKDTRASLIWLFKYGFIELF